MCERQRFTIRTSDEIVRRIEALAGISGESKNSVANVLLAIQLGGVTCGATFNNEKPVVETEEGPSGTVVDDNVTLRKSGATKKKVSSPPTPPSPSQKKKGISKDIPKKEKDSEKIALGNGRKPKSFEACVEYFEYRRIPNFREKARQFYDYYEGNGWFMGRSPIRKWSCCLTTWISNNPGWEPVEIDEPKNIELKKILAWMKKEHEEWYRKFKGVKNINEIDGYYIDEFRGA